MVVETYFGEKKLRKRRKALWVGKRCGLGIINFYGDFLPHKGSQMVCSRRVGSAPLTLWFVGPFPSFSTFIFLGRGQSSLDDRGITLGVEQG